MSKNVGYSQSFYGALTGHLDGGKKTYGQLKKLLKNGEITETQATDYLANLMAFCYMTNQYKLYYNDAALYLRNFMNMLSLKSDLVMTTRESFEPIDKAIYYDNIDWIVELPSAGRYYFPCRSFDAPGEIPGRYQGRTVARRPEKGKKNNKSGIMSRTFSMPITTPEQNLSVSDIAASINGTALDISRREENHGVAKARSLSLLSEEDIVNGYLSYLNRYGMTITFKEKGKKADEREERYRDGREQQFKDIMEEIKSYHNTDAAEVKSYSIDNIGIDPDSSSMTYKIDYVMNGIVKKAGKNIIISVGNLIGSQVEIPPLERTRTDSVYMSAPREYRTRIAIDIPTGYRVSEKTMNALKENISNSTGLFSADAFEENGQLKIDIIKRYSHKTEPADKWPDLIKILDAANNWRARTVLFEK